MSDDPDHRKRLAGSAHAGLDKILQAQGFSQTAADALLDIDAEMFRWRALQQRGDLISVLLRRVDCDLENASFQGMLAISRCSLGLDGGEAHAPTIGEIAVHLNIDPSRASRIVSDLIDKGYVRREVDQGDGRRTVLVLTDQAGTLMGRFREAKWKVLSGLFNHWNDRDIGEFARLLRLYLDGIAAIPQPAADSVKRAG